MLDHLRILQSKRIFRKSDVVSVAQNVRTAESILLSYQKKGIISKIRRDLYCINNLATGLPDVSKYEIASAISQDSYVAFHSALEFYGLSHQVWNEVSVCSSSRFSSFLFDDIAYSMQQSKIDVSVMEPLMQRGVRVTTLERTVVDCIARLDIAGGYEEFLHCAESLSVLDEKKLTEILVAYDSPIVWKKVGYVLQNLQSQTKVSDSFLLMCRNKGGDSVNFMTNKNECPVYVKEWKIYVPFVFNNAYYEII